MGEPFDSAWLKWGRAIVHAHELESDIDRFKLQPDRQEITLGYRHYDPKRHGFPVEIAAVEPWPATWGPLLGDVVANFRASLDQIAWATVHRGRGGKKGFPLSTREARDVYYPIYTDRETYNAEVARKLIGARRTDLAIIRPTQPYILGKRRATNHAFAILDDLGKRDRHRTIQPVHMVIQQANYTFIETRDCIPSPDTRKPGLRHARLEVGAELGVVRVRKTGPNPYAHVDTGIGVAPGVTDRARLDEWLQKTADLLRALLFRFGSVPPDELVELGDPTWFFSPSEIAARGF